MSSSLIHSFIEEGNSRSADFPLNNLPFGVFYEKSRPLKKFSCTAIGDKVFNLSLAEELGLISDLGFSKVLLNSFMEKGKNHYTHLPIAIDGSCNGLQIFSLMLRDEVGGEATNLTPRDKPQDIYGIVSDKTTAQLKLETSDDLVHRKYPITKKQLAKLWLDY